MFASAKSHEGSLTDTIEEGLIAFLLGVMTLITFFNVIARYVFNSNILWALEVSVFLFAWMVLLGASYCVKKSLHLGVDVVLVLLPRWLQKTFALVAVVCCIVYAALLLKGSWDYWYPFVTTRAWLETNDVPMPFFLRFFESLVNEGEAYEKMPRFIPYAVLPLSMALLLFRFVQVGWLIWTDERRTVIAGHEAEEAIAKAAAKED